MKLIGCCLGLIHVFSLSAKGRIISLAPSVTEVIYALGAGDSLVGNTVFCNYPHQAKQVKNVSFRSGPNKELILSLKPSLVIGASINRESTFHDLKKLSIKAVRVETKKLQQLPANIVKIGKLVGKEVEAAKLANKIKKELNTSLKRKSIGKKFVLALSLEPLYSASPKTWLGQVFARAGFQNLVDSKLPDWPKLSTEVFHTKNVDVLFYVANYRNKARWPEEVTAQEKKVKKFLGKIGVKAHPKVVILPPDIFERPGPRLVKAMEFLQKL